MFMAGTDVCRICSLEELKPPGYFSTEHLLFVLLFLFSQEIEDKLLRPEKAEEAKLKARYPHLGNKPGGSDLLRKRLQKGVSRLWWLFFTKFFQVCL